MVLQVLFWILFILAAIGAFITDTPTNQHINKGRWAVVLILIGILGYHIFGSPAR